MALRRVELGETNVRGHMFYSMVSGKFAPFGPVRVPTSLFSQISTLESIYLVSWISAGIASVDSHSQQVIGLIEAMETGTPQQEGIYKGAKQSAEICYNILKARTPAWTAASNPSIDTNPNNSTPAHPSQTTPGDGSANSEVDVQNFGFEFLQGGALDDIGLPDSWLFTGWDAFGD